MASAAGRSVSCCDVDEPCLEPVPGRAPPVLLEQDRRGSSGAISPHSKALPIVADERLDERGDCGDVLDACLRVADPHLDGAVAADADGCPTRCACSRGSSPRGRRARRGLEAREGRRAREGGPCGGGPRGSCARVEASPVGRPCQNGELAESARSSGGSRGRRRRRRSPSRPSLTPTWTCRPKTRWRAASQPRLSESSA